jgi:hypothetical protein
VPVGKRSSLLVTSLFLLLAAPFAMAWGPEGHAIVALIAEKNMSASALRRSKTILRGASLEDVASWPDEVVHLLPSTAPWHYIDIPLRDSTINVVAECRKGDCVLVKTEQFLSVLKDPNALRPQKALALKFVVHFIGDLHQPLHCENNNDEGGNTREVIFEGHPDRLHWVWDTGLLQEIDPNPEQFAVELERQITPGDRRAWENGTIEDWILESHRLDQAVVYGDLGRKNPARIGPAYKRAADPVIERQLEKAGVRLAWLLNTDLKN